MSSKPSINLIDNRGNFFGGASQIDSMMQWSLSRFESTTGSQPKLSFTHLQVQGTAGTALPEDSFMRLRCHLLVEQIPLAGLAELLERMEEIYEFYTIKSAEQNPALPNPEKVKVKIGETSVRPEFRVEDEVE